MTEKDINKVEAWQNAPFSEYMWAQDFIGFLSERPKIVRLILRFIFGRKAYREFIGMVDVFVKIDQWLCVPSEAEYHKEKVRNDFTEGLKLC